jgi:hypothetical protein
LRTGLPLYVIDARLARLCNRNIGGFVGKLTTNVFAVPTIFAGGCVLMYLNERRTIGTVIAAGGADATAYRTATISLQQNLFFCIFLLYLVRPMLATTQEMRFGGTVW